MELFYCPKCGNRFCDVIGIVCADCIIQAKRREPSRAPIQGTCYYCLREDLWLVEDHVVPLARGGAPEGWNIVRACERCNGKKSDYLPSEWCPEHEKALAIQRLHKTIFPRMRNGRLIGDHAESYARVRGLCSNFCQGIWIEIGSLQKPQSDLLYTAWKSVEKLQRRINDIIQNAEAKGGDRGFSGDLQDLKQGDEFQREMRERMKARDPQNGST